MLAVVTPKCAEAGLKDWTCTWPDRWYTGVCLGQRFEIMPEEKCINERREGSGPMSEGKEADR